MKNTTIKLNNDIAFDLPKLIDSRLLIQANSGGGKSYAIRRIIEQAFGKVQIIVLDPEGEFTNLREKLDFVYAGKGGDAPVESRSAAMLAHKLLELKASTTIDLYEMPPQERKHFVRLFCQAMVDAPKELWHEVLVIIDEAHVFAPEKGESEAMDAVIDLATRGRKRGYCVVLATQRLPKLNKDAAAECNNKLIGRASQDIDRKRAAEELGFTTKEQILSLRDLNPGEFYVFGPAICRDVTRIVIGDVTVKPPARGSARSLKTPPPSAAVKKILGELKDLPQEALKEARTVAELQSALRTAQGEITRLKANPVVKEPAAMGVSQWRELGKKLGYWDHFEKQINQAAGLQWEKVVKEWKSYATRLRTVFDKPEFIIKPTDVPMGWFTPSNLETATLVPQDKIESLGERNLDEMTYGDGIKIISDDAHDIQKTWRIHGIKDTVAVSNGEGSTLGKGELIVLKAVAAQPDGMTREHITVQTGYKRSTRDAYIQRLVAKEYIQVLSEKICITVKGIEALGPNYEPLPTGQALIDYHLRVLPKGERDILAFILSKPGYTTPREFISEATGFQRSTRDAYIQRLMTRQLIISTDPGEVKASPHLYE